ncbi:hypothetical protein HED60_00665 [Planctomycetales bacterium ZRK34]|nr:hypothetical protein HED60_00665 [Planctomycetales bacterium ZRK34]
MAALLGGTLRADTVFETLNGGFTPGNFFWAADDTGWYWTPSMNVDLVGIQTKLATNTNINNNFTFTTTVYTDRPDNGGMVLDSFTWNGTAFVDGPWLGGSFSSPLSLTGGTTYFLGFSGWLAAVTGSGGAGVMMVGPADSSGNATAGTTLLDGWISGSGNPGSFDTPYATGSWPNTPILRFIAADSSTIPEPAAASLIGLPALAMAMRRRRRG